MIKNENNIPAGYKDSAVGIIPQEWEVKTLINLGDFLKTNTLSRDKMNDIKGNVHNIHYGDVLIKYPEILDINKRDIPWINEDYNIRLGDYLANGDVIISDTAEDYTVGKATEIIGVSDEKVVAGLHTMAYRPYSSRFASCFLGYYINSSFYRKQLFSQIQGIKVCSISKSGFSNTSVCIPSILEQQKIVEILRTWDEAIEKQTKLIKALEKRKQALMQRLLSGRTRLPGFTGEWKKEKLMDIGIFLSTNNFPRDKMNETEGTIMNVHYGDILIKYPTIVDLKTINVPYLNNGIKVKSDLLKNGDVIIADTAEDKIVGKAIEIVNIGTHQIVSGLHTFAFRPNESLFVNRFLGYYLNSVGYRKQLESLIQGIKVCSISKSSILNTYISIPLIKEQQAIVNILVSADDEIKRHNTKLSQLRKQKRGLMQQLLTGKKRVK